MLKLKDLLEFSPTGNVKGVKGATGFIKPEEWDAKKKSLKKSIENTTGYLLVERIDYEDTAKQLVKHYGLRSKVRFGKVKGQNEADYDWVNDIINLKKSYPSVKEFIVSVLHEIDHAKMRKKMGYKKYEQEYTIAGQDADDKGGDFHDDNFFEEQAEKWAQKEYRKVWSKKYK